MTLYTDIDPFCCEVLRARVADGGLPPGEVLEQDVTTLDPSGYTQVHLFCGIGGIPLGMSWAGWPTEWSIVTGGFPCQDVSVAGKGLGVEGGARSGLWREMHRVIDLVRPTWVLAENVPALRTRGADRVLGDLEQLGYACWPLVVGAEHVGAPHRRHRVWIVGHSGGTRAGDALRADRGQGGESARTPEPASVRQAHGPDGSRRTDSAGGDGGPVDEPNGRMRDGRKHKPERGQDRRTAVDGAGEAGGGCMAHPLSDGRGSGRRDQRDQRERRDQSAGGVQLADAAGGGLGAERDEPCESGGGDRGHADGGGATVDDSTGPRRAGNADSIASRAIRIEARRAESAGSDCGGPSVEHPVGAGREERHPPALAARAGQRGWPMPPGPHQHPWEAPRLIESQVGSPVDGVSRRLAGYIRRSGLKALGNSVVPQCVEIVARGMIEFGRTA